MGGLFNKGILRMVTVDLKKVAPFIKKLNRFEKS